MALISAIPSLLDERESGLRLAGLFPLVSFDARRSCLESRFRDLKGDVLRISGRTGGDTIRDGSPSGDGGCLVEPLHAIQDNAD